MIQKIAFFVACNLFIAFSCFTLLVQSIEENPIKLEQKKGFSLISAFIPQGWSFFTKNPQEYQLKIYDFKDPSLSQINTKNVQLKQFFGLKKSNRLLPHLIEKNFKLIPEEHWYKTRDEFNHVSMDSLNIYRITLPENNNIFNASQELLIQLAKPVPWLYFAKKDFVAKDYFYIILKFEEHENKPKKEEEIACE